MSLTDDKELQERADEIDGLNKTLKLAMASGSLSAVLTVAAKVEDAARQMGWRTLEIEKQRCD